MDGILFFITCCLLALYCWKVLLHYKLLRIEQENYFDRNEDYFMSFLMKNTDFILKTKTGSLSKINESYNHPQCTKHKKQINRLLQIIRTGLILLLGLVLIRQVFNISF
jgi:hypothetical protein